MYSHPNFPFQSSLFYSHTSSSSIQLTNDNLDDVLRKYGISPGTGSHVGSGHHQGPASIMNFLIQFQFIGNLIFAVILVSYLNLVGEHSAPVCLLFGAVYWFRQPWVFRRSVLLLFSITNFKIFIWLRNYPLIFEWNWSSNIIIRV